MPSLTVLSCPVCAAPLQPEDPRCAYCGSVVVIRTDHPRIDSHLLNRAVVDEHIAQYRLAVRRDNNDETAHYGLGVAYFNLGLLDEAAEELTQAARLMPENSHIQTQLAVVFADLAAKGRDGANTLAWDRVNRALLLQPKHVEALMLKAELHHRKGEWTFAIDALKEAATEKPDVANRKLVEMLLEKADMHGKSGSWPQAVAAWREAALVGPDAVRTPIAKFLSANAPLVSGFNYHQTPPAASSKGYIPDPTASAGPIRRYVMFALAALVLSCVVFSAAVSALDTGPTTTTKDAVLLTVVLLAFVTGIGSIVMPPFIYLQVRSRKRRGIGTSSSGHSGSWWSRRKQARLEKNQRWQDLLAGRTQDVTQLLEAAQHVATTLQRKR